jgi:hypothetical protein
MKMTTTMMMPAVPIGASSGTAISRNTWNGEACGSSTRTTSGSSPPGRCCRCCSTTTLPRPPGEGDDVVAASGCCSCAFCSSSLSSLNISEVRSKMPPLGTMVCSERIFAWMLRW